MKKSEKRRGISCATLLWLFVFGSVAGFVIEGLWCVARKGHWENHASTVWGAFCIIYGIGAVAVYLLASLLGNKPTAVQFAVFTVSGGVIEYGGSLLQERLFGSVSWDYSGHFLNLGGRVSLQMALTWGVLGILFLRLLFPALRRLLNQMRGGAWRLACLCMTVYMAVNLSVSAAAVTRWRARLDGCPAESSVARWLDQAYDDDAMTARYPNMRFVDTDDAV